MSRSLVYTIIFLVVALLTTSCGSGAERPTYRIGISQCSRDDWREKMNEEIRLESLFHPEATVEIRSADDSNEKQISDIRYFRDNGFDIIIAAPNEADAITPIIREVYEGGTPVIVFDRDINGETYTAYQGVDNRAMGRAAAHYARHLTGPGGRVLEIYGLAGSTPAVGRHEGFAEGAAAEGLVMLGCGYGHWNYEDALPVADSLLGAHPDADLIYAHNDRMAIAASEAARRRGLDVRVIGIDGAPDVGVRAVADSVIDATFLYPTEGQRLVRTALAILEGKPYARETLLPVSSAVDPSNADIILLQNESLKEEGSKIRLLKGQVDEFWDRHSAQTTLVYAFVIILVLLMGVLFLVLRAYWQHRRHQRQLMEQNRLLEEQRDTERSLNEQLAAATQSKLAFFTNVSHDLRTPLTLIAEPVDQMVRADNLTPQQSALMRIADKNVRILRRLINQILDFRKYENGKLDLHPVEADVAALLTEWAEAFRAAARHRDIKLNVEVSLPEDFTMAVDVEKLERVVYNLLSNAFKFTPDNGRIRFAASAADGHLTLTVDDTGRGIPAADLPNVFDRFYQSARAHPGGSGIGLALVKAFVELHGGEIAVESREGEGTRFTVSLPVKHVAEPAEPTPVCATISADDIDAELSSVDDSAAAEDADSAKPLLLVIDDNPDMRRMAAELLGDEYCVIGAPDGREGLRLAARRVPDLVICDVMMPVMDGLECCRRIKAELSTSHIPVLMLTACALDEQRADGYESGADGYLSKPFSADVLRARCRNLIDNRRRIRDLWTGTAPTATSATPGPTAAPRPDVEDEFYARFLSVVTAEMGNPELNVDSLASRLGLGRSQFYRKIKALTNYTPVELLRSLRLKRSRELLTTTSRTVSEIAYQVGFSTPAYFTRCYREAYGETPTELRERLGAK